MTDIWVTETDSPVGRLGLALSEAGLMRLCNLRGELGPSGHSTAEELAAEIEEALPARVTVAAAPFDEVRRQLDDYFSGRRRRFTVPVDWQDMTGFRRAVLEVTAGIPYGTTRSYGSVAAGAGNPQASRAVGSAMANNPVAIIVPCHRVVNADGSRGNYGGGPEAKNYLLDLEHRVGAID